MSTPPPSSDDPRADPVPGPRGTPSAPRWGEPPGEYPRPGEPVHRDQAPQSGQYLQPGQHDQPGPYGQGPYGQQQSGQYAPSDQQGHQWGAPQPWPGQQPQFGPPSGQPSPSGQFWGPGQAPPPPKRDRTRSVLIGVLVALCLAIAGCVVALVFALSSTVLDRSAVESAVATQFEEREGVTLDLDCPQRMEVASGEVYRCTGTTSDGEAVTIEIQIADSLDGAYTWSEG